MSGTVSVGKTGRFELVKMIRFWLIEGAVYHNMTCFVIEKSLEIVICENLRI